MSIIHDPQPQIALFHEENIFKRGNGVGLITSLFCVFVIKTLYAKNEGPNPKFTFFSVGLPN